MAKKKSKAEGRPRGRPKKRLNPGLAVVFARREAERAAALASDDRTVHPQPRQHPAAAAAPPHAEANGGEAAEVEPRPKPRRRARRDAPPGPPRRSDRRREGVERFEAGPAALPFSKARAHKIRIARARRKYEELRGRIREDELRAARRRNAELESENARLEGATKQGSAAELGPRPRPSSSAETPETSGRDEPSSRRPSSVRDGLVAAAAPAASTANAFVPPNAFGSSTGATSFGRAAAAAAASSTANAFVAPNVFGFSTGATSFGNPWYRQHYPYYGMMSAPFGCFPSAAQMDTGFPAYLAATTLQLGRPTLGTLVRPPAAMHDMSAYATSSNPPPASSGTAGGDDGSASPPPLAVAVSTEDGGGDDKDDEAAPGCGSGGGGLDGPAPGKSPTAVAVGSADRPCYTREPGTSAIIGLRFDV